MWGSNAVDILADGRRNKTVMDVGDEDWENGFEVILPGHEENIKVTAPKGSKFFTVSSKSANMTLVCVRASARG